MNILWESDEPMIASAILKKGNGLKLTTVRASIKKLLEKKCIEPAGVVHSGTVLSQSYRPIITKDDYISDVKLGINNVLQEETLFAYYLDSLEDMDTLLKLEKVIQNKKKELERK